MPFGSAAKTITAEHINLLQKVQYSDAAEIGRAIIERYKNGEIDSVYLINNEFKSVMAQNAVTVYAPSAGRIAGAEGAARLYFEQPPLQMLERLLPRYLEVEIYRGLLETSAAEHAARMTSMDAASSNAGDVIQSLTLNLNRVRQAAITREIIEVVSGASASE